MTLQLRWVVASVTAVIMIAGLSSCSESTENHGAVGYIEAEWHYISSPQPGRILARHVSQGDRVQVGDRLFELDSAIQRAALEEAQARVAQQQAEVLNNSTGARPEEVQRLEAKLAEAEAALQYARAEQKRIASLVEQGMEPRSKGDQVEATLEQTAAIVKTVEKEIAVARLAARPAVREIAMATLSIAEAARNGAKLRLEERTVLAAISGKVEAVFHHEGEFVNTGVPVLAILPEDGLKLKFFVSQNILPEIELGKPVLISADGLASPIEALISFISTEPEYTPPVIYSNKERQKLVFLVEAKVPVDSGLLPGLPVDVSWAQ